MLIQHTLRGGPFFRRDFHHIDWAALPAADEYREDSALGDVGDVIERRTPTFLYGALVHHLCPSARAHVTQTGTLGERMRGMDAATPRRNAPQPRAATRRNAPQPRAATRRATP